MATVTKSVDEMIDDAIERLPFLRRNIVKRNLARNPAKRVEIADQVLLALSEDTAAKTAFGAGISEGIASGAITAQTPIGIDVDKLEQILALIFKYLPQILQLFQLFVSIAIFLAAMLAVASSSSIALAQGGNCANGVCSLGARAAAVVGLQPVSDSSPRIAASPISPQIAAVVPRFSTVFNQARPLAVLATTRKRFETKPVRSLIWGSKPICRAVNAIRRR